MKAIDLQPAATCLLAHADDNRGFLRNPAGFRLSEIVGLAWTPAQVPCELVVNGEYRGLYFATELIKDGMKIGTVVKIYPLNDRGDANALACNGNGSFLTSYKEAGAGDMWTIEDAGDNYIYLKNELGCYWAYQGKSSSQSLTCTTDKNAAVKIGVTIKILYYFEDHPVYAFFFWNKENDTALNNLNHSGNLFNWWSSRLNYDSDTNASFWIEVVKEGSGKLFLPEFLKVREGDILYGIRKNASFFSAFSFSFS